MRQNGTFASVAFQEVDQQHVRQRNQNTFNSSVFGEPVPVKPNRKKLEPQSAGVGRLFGTDKVQYERSSHNECIAQVDRPKATVNQISAKEQVKREFHGEAAAKYGMNENKRDGALIAQNVSWKNANERAIESRESQLKSSALDAKDRTYQNYQSSVFGGGYIDQQEIKVDREQTRTKFTTNADWKEPQAKKAPLNGFMRQDSYKAKQKCLSSTGIFEQTDYSAHLPLTKQNSEATLERQHNARKAREFYGKQTDVEFKDWNFRQEKIEDAYSANTRKRMIFDGNHGDFIKSEIVEEAPRPAMDRPETRKREEIVTKKQKISPQGSSSIYNTLK